MFRPIPMKRRLLEIPLIGFILLIAASLSAFSLSAEAICSGLSHAHRSSNPNVDRVFPHGYLDLMTPRRFSMVEMPGSGRLIPLGFDRELIAITLAALFGALAGVLLSIHHCPRWARNSDCGQQMLRLAFRQRSQPKIRTVFRAGTLVGILSASLGRASDIGIYAYRYRQFESSLSQVSPNHPVFPHSPFPFSPVLGVFTLPELVLNLGGVFAVSFGLLVVPSRRALRAALADEPRCARCGYHLDPRPDT